MKHKRLFLNVPKGILPILLLFIVASNLVFLPISLSENSTYTLRRVRSLDVLSKINSEPSAGELLSDSQRQQLRATFKSSSAEEFSSELKGKIEARAEQTLYEEESELLVQHLLANSRIQFKIDDLGANMTYPQGNLVSWMEIVNDQAYVHVTEAFWDAYKGDLDTLAKLVVREYRKAFLPEYILAPGRISQRDGLLQDLDRIKQLADVTEKKSSLFGMMADYDPTIDTAGVLKFRLLEEIKKIDPATLATGDELLMWYRAHIETDVDLGELTRIIKSSVRKDLIDNYLFEYTPKVPLPGTPGLANGEKNTDRKMVLPSEGKILDPVKGIIHVFDEKIGYVYNNGEPVLLPQLYFDPSLPSSVYESHEAERDFLKSEEERLKGSDEMTAIREILSGIVDGRAGYHGLQAIGFVKQLAEEIQGKITKGDIKIGDKIFAEAYLTLRLNLHDVVSYLSNAAYDAVALDMAVGRIEAQIEKENISGRPLILSIIGPQGGGKSTFAEFLHKRLAAELGTDAVAKWGVEDYLYAKPFRYIPLGEGGHEMRGSGMYDWEYTLGQITAIRDGETIIHPKGNAVDTSRLKVFIFEGPLTAHGVQLQGLLDMVIGFAEYGSEDRFDRRLNRDSLSKDGRMFSEGYMLQEFAQKQFHQETDIMMRDASGLANFVICLCNDRLFEHP